MGPQDNKPLAPTYHRFQHPRTPHPNPIRVQREHWIHEGPKHSLTEGCWNGKAGWESGILGSGNRAGIQLNSRACMVFMRPWVPPLAPHKEKYLQIVNKNIRSQRQSPQPPRQLIPQTSPPVTATHGHPAASTKYPCPLCCQQLYTVPCPFIYLFFRGK